jgi:hypothetical protein
MRNAARTLKKIYLSAPVPAHLWPLLAVRRLSRTVGCLKRDSVIVPFQFSSLVLLQHLRPDVLYVT